MPSLHRVYFLVHDLIVISLTGRLQALYRPSLLKIPNFGELKLFKATTSMPQSTAVLFVFVSNPLSEMFAVSTPFNIA